ncbi:PucR family transcriptional regulator [Gordonia rubripertincta]|uniref:PucR family transcriptional regulator n=1 Tax=Gordonia rubripertincta TaxID=36822 RepID=A0ABT4MY23_GORRU|nr:PucR family transcriptional regulator [Gordonia rubripertincta]MCZ4551912.1 PucR family transcriptional regulator [Gordonia rubripertincta]
MVLTLRDVLDRHLAAADPQVLSGHDGLDNEVRWVHSSEIFEIGPLLSGGELLLTTGLGLAGVDSGTRRHYIRELAQRGVAGVAVELGRTFDEAPGEMVREASSARFPFIVLRTVVPFIDLCRAANTDLVSQEVGALRRRSELDAALHAEMAAGTGAPAMLKCIAAAVGCPLVLLGKGNALMAAEGLDDDHSAWQAVDAQAASVPVGMRGEVVATLVAGPGSPLDVDDLLTLLEVGAGPLGVTLSLTRELAGLPHRAASSLVSDLLERRIDRRSDLVMRLGAAGFRPARTSQIVPVAVDVPTPRMASRITASVVKSLAAQSMHAQVHATSYALIATGRPGNDDVTVIADAYREFADGATVVVGDPVPIDAQELSTSLLRVRHALALAVADRQIVGGSADAVTSTRALAADLAMETLDAAVRDDLLAVIAPVIAWDAEHGSELTRTLEVHLRHGCSATRSAAALNLGRQSLYQRLERIRGLIGFDFTAAQTYPGLLLALCAHRAQGRRRRSGAELDRLSSGE